MQLNKKSVSNLKTHEGGQAKKITPLQELTRSSLACMLWEDSFYENGESIADRISNLSHKVSSADLSNLAIKARKDYKLRHFPMLLARNLVNHPNIQDRSVISDTIFNIVDRADELSEFLSLYWKDGKKPIAAQVKKGLARAFAKFDEYQLAKYNRDKAIKLRDVLFMVHAKPETKAQEILWKRLVDNELAIPDTWEVGLSTSTDKAGVFTRLIQEKKLPAMATLKNIRLMEESGVSKELIRQAIKNMRIDRILPFRFVTAARYNPMYEDVLEQSMFDCIEGMKKLEGKTVLLIDVSGSMDAPISQKSKMSRIDAANGLSILAREMCEDVVVYTFSDRTASVPPRRGFALRDAINKSQPHGCTYLAKSLKEIHKKESNVARTIVFTDEQSQDGVSAPLGKGYCINVASYQNGVAYGNDWTNVTGFSENTLRYIQELESESF